jgi:hypothetical protein
VKKAFDGKRFNVVIMMQSGGMDLPSLSRALPEIIQKMAA